MRKSGIIDFRFYDLRHSFSSYLALNGVDINTIRELLGHKSLRMTMRYAHLSPEHKKRAVHILDKSSGTNSALKSISKTSKKIALSELFDTVSVT